MNAKKFLASYFFITFILSIPLCMNLLFLYNSGELTSIDNVVQKQIHSETLYGIALTQNTFHYKLDLVEKIKPEIITLGSSRVMAFRKELFNASFVNTGGAVNCIPEAEKFVDAMLKLHKPKIIIFGIDDWWFNDNAPASEWENPQNDDTQTITTDKLLFPFKQIISKNISLADYVRICFNFDQNYISNILNSNLLGVTAIIKQNGFRSDGSYFYGSTITSRNEGDFQFKDTHRRLSTGVDRFEYSNELSIKKWTRFELLVKKLRSEGIEVIVFLPPYSQTAYDNLRHKNDKYIHITQISEKIKNTDIKDFRNPKILTLTDCDFIDGFHGSEMAYMKLLSKLDNRILQSMVQKDVIKTFLESRYNTNICVPIGFTKEYKEKDFLGIGCRRDIDCNQ